MADNGQPADNRDEEEEEGFEGHLSRLENAVTKLEEGNLSLDESLRTYEQGIKAYRRCHEILEEATGKIEKLMESVEGELSREPFEQGSEGEDEQ